MNCTASSGSTWPPCCPAGRRGEGSAGAAGTDDVASWLRLLDIPHTVTPAIPPDGGPGPAYLLGVAWTDLPHLRQWAHAAAAKAERRYKDASGTWPNDS
jgi:hypothetical protein